MEDNRIEEFTGSWQGSHSRESILIGKILLKIYDTINKPKTNTFDFDGQRYSLEHIVHCDTNIYKTSYLKFGFRIQLVSCPAIMCEYKTEEEAQQKLDEFLSHFK